MSDQSNIDSYGMTDQSEIGNKAFQIEQQKQDEERRKEMERAKKEQQERAEQERKRREEELRKNPRWK